MPVSSDCLSISASIEGKVRNRWGEEKKTMQPLLAGGSRPLHFSPVPRLRSIPTQPHVPKAWEVRETGAQ